MRFLVPVLALATTAAAQDVGTMDWPTGEVVPRAFDRFDALDGGVVHVEGASWLRLYFAEVLLSPGSVVRITSVLDNEVQELDAAALARWGNTSAYFNGDTVLVEVVGGQGFAGTHLELAAVGRNAAGEVAGGSGDCGICDADDRVPSGEPWACRLLPAGCTATVFNEASCLVSAGHCIQGSMVVQFNVPDSNGDCSINNPPVADQFPILTTDSVNGGVGNDWAVLVPGTNTLGELPFERYGRLRPIASIVPSPGVIASVWGYGVDNTCTRSQTQQTDTGSIVALDATTLQWDIDIRGGNSGSSIIHNGEIIGIVTHCNTGGCPAAPNLGTRIDLSSFAAARDAMCGEELLFTFPGGLAELISPAGGSSMRVVVSADTGTPMPGTGTVYTSLGGGPFVSTAMSETAPNDYQATFAAIDCGTVVEFYFTAETVSGLQVSSPRNAPGQLHVTVAGEALATVFDDDFEADRGWTVSGDATDGQWDRGVPIALSTCDRGNPGADGDGSGQCFLTDNSSAGQCNSDVDGGSTILTSPVLDASDPHTVVSFRRWYSTTAGSNAFQDVMQVQVSSDGGSTWTELETVGPTGSDVDGAWFLKSFSVADFVSPTSLFQVRFIASDTDPQSVVEAAVDEFLLRTVVCPEPDACPWDLDAGGDVGITDFLELLAQWATDPGGPPDFDGDGTVGITAFLELLANWGPC